MMLVDRCEYKLIGSCNAVGATAIIKSLRVAASSLIYGYIGHCPSATDTFANASFWAKGVKAGITRCSPAALKRATDLCTHCRPQWSIKSNHMGEQKETAKESIVHIWTETV